ncbi:MAG: twitch domain-containing radical SAM protein [Bdellovibrionales bacterium]|nr:twitch domain-containing radical SAM protein [Bdellovibrionales bacterium]
MEKLKSIKQEISSTFCVLPWIHIATRAGGEVTPCCVGEGLGENLNVTNFSKVWNSKALRGLRKKMLQGKSSSVCKRCYEEEKVNIASHRVRSNKYWKDYYSFSEFKNKTDKRGYFSSEPIYLDLRLGNKCNLECSMCGPQESIRWENSLYNIDKHVKTLDLKAWIEMKKNSLKKESLFWYEREDIKKDLSSKIPFLKRVTIAGGEPLLIKEHHWFLEECIKKKQAHHISLHYHTNGTLLDRNLFDKWKYFESVMVFISLDALGDKNYYIRYPCSWSRIEKNLELIDKKSHPNVHPMILCTLQIKNIFYFEEFINYIMNKKFKKVHAYYEDLVHTEVVHHPYFLSCQLLPLKVKDLVTKKFENICNTFPSKSNRFKTIVDFMNQQDKSHQLPVFYDYIQSLDQSRGTDFSKTFPELTRLLNEDKTWLN